MNQHLLTIQDFIDACRSNGVIVEKTTSQTPWFGDKSYSCINVNIKCMGEFNDWLRTACPERVWIYSLSNTTNAADWSFECCLRFAFIPENPWRTALRRIAAIQDQMQGGDWEEIELARNIANAALEGRALPDLPEYTEEGEG